MTGDKWVKMTADEYVEYRRGRVANETAYREGYDRGYEDACSRLRKSPEEAEMENDEN